MKTTTILSLLLAVAARADTATIIERSLEITPAGATDLVPHIQGRASEMLEIEGSTKMRLENFTITADFAPAFDFPSIYISKDRKSGK